MGLGLLGRKQNRKLIFDILFCLVDRVAIPIAVRSKEWRYLKRSVSSVFAAAYQIIVYQAQMLAKLYRDGQQCNVSGNNI
jgi:hypothetical protein